MTPRPDRPKPTRTERVVRNKRQRGEGTAEDIRTNVEKIRETLNDPLARLGAIVVAVALLFLTTRTIKADVERLEPRVSRIAVRLSENEVRLDELEFIDRRLDNLGARVKGIDETLDRITKAIRKAIRKAAEEARAASESS